MVENGISFEEPDFVEDKEDRHGLDYENKDFYHNRLNLPFPPELNKTKAKKNES